MTRALTLRLHFLWTACAGMAVVADTLFYGHPWGVNTALFGMVVVIAVVLRSPGLWRSWMGRSWILLAGMALIALVEEPSPLAVIMAIVTLGMLVLASQRNIGERVSDWANQWLHLLATLFFRVLLDNAIVARWCKRHPYASNRLATLARLIAWWFLPVMAGAIFVLLFAAANPIIEHWVRWAFNTLWTIFDWLPLYLQADRMFLWFAVIAGTYGLLRYRRMRVRRTAYAVPPVVAPPATWWTGQDLIIRCLIVFNVVFAVQSILDVIYLFGGAKLPDGMSYQEYAHRGAYPLVATALLTALFVLITFRTGGPAQRSPLARGLVYAWIGQNLFLMVSTIWRLYLYVTVDQLTRLRLSTMIWLFLVAMGFVWTILKIRRGLSNAWLWRVNIQTTFAVLFLCAFINFDGIIADYNVRHCVEFSGEGRSIDLAYLYHLGPDALPALADLREKDHLHGLQIDAIMSNLRQELEYDIKDWRGWTYRRWREAPGDMRTTFLTFR